MQQKQSLADEITHILASIEGEDTPPLEPEKLETYHVYPTDGGILIVREDEEPGDNRTIETTLAKKKPDVLGYLICIFYVFLILSCFAFSLYLAFFPPIVTVTIIPKSQTITAYGTLQIVSGSLTGTGQLPGRFLSPITLSQSDTAPTTGKGHQDAKAAHGFITFYNGQFTAQTVPAGTVLTGANGIQIVIDQDAYIPAANPPVFGQVTISAHAKDVGSKGNIPAYDINQACCFPSVLAKNTAPFTGGQDERNFQTVTKNDIDGIATPLKASLSQSMQGALTGQLKNGEALQILPCRQTVTPDHQIGIEATTVKVTVSETCNGIAYNDQELTSKVTQLLTAQATTKLGAGYSILENPQITITSATPSKQVILSFSSVSTWVYALSSAEQQHIKTIIAGKTKANAIQLLHHLSGIERVSMQFTGFGDDTRMPKNLSNIHLLIFYGS